MIQTSHPDRRPAASLARGHDPAPQALSPAVFAILLALGDGHRHGYGIMKEVEERTDGRVRLLPGSLYSTIRRMLTAGWLEETIGGGADDDPRRRYYALTEEGRWAAAAEFERMTTLVALAEEKRLTPRHLQPIRSQGR